MENSTFLAQIALDLKLVQPEELIERAKDAPPRERRERDGGDRGRRGGGRDRGRGRGGQD